MFATNQAMFSLLVKPNQARARGLQQISSVTGHHTRTSGHCIASTVMKTFNARQPKILAWSKALQKLLDVLAMGATEMAKRAKRTKIARVVTRTLATRGLATAMMDRTI